MTDALQVALIVMLAIFTLAFIAMSFLAIQVLFLVKRILRDLKYASSTVKLANRGVQSLGLGFVNTLLSLLKGGEIHGR